MTSELQAKISPPRLRQMDEVNEALVFGIPLTL
jgi:hypothetical protein